MATRRALSIGVARFDRHEELEFAPDLVRALAGALQDLGYEVDAVPADTMAGTELGALVTESLTSGDLGDLRVVHLVSHGEGADGGATVFAIGSDGVRHGDASIAHWLTMQQNGDRPDTLFLLDLCSAGVSARLPWQAQLAGPLRGWVIAGTAPHGAAYDGRFTKAVINVLRSLRAGELDIDPSAQHVPIDTVARAIRQEVNRLVAEADAYPQQVTASQLDISVGERPPFFTNPAYRPDTRLRLRAAVDPGVLPFLDDLDEGLDARHFVERATGLGGLASTGTEIVGCFTGRDPQLKLLSRWLEGKGDEPLHVVTGSPGSGKSALLGVLVCAASPLLREDTRPIWEDVARAPGTIADITAVHARQRGLAAVVASIARQLGLPEGTTTAELVTALRGRNTRPVVVVDALDEADGSTQLMTELLLPLTDRDAPGSPVRLLVGVRSYQTFAPLFERAVLVDLDDVAQHTLENDLYKYVTSLLRASADRPPAGVVGEFADAVATVLATPTEDGRRRWGPFLVAGLYTRHFLNTHTRSPVTADEAATQGRQVPNDLPGVLELDLEMQQDQVWLHPVMTALAHARGTGMPVSLLARAAPVFADPALAPPSVADIRAALTAGKFYLRQSQDTDQSNIYRLFHQALAETLGKQARPSPLLDALLATLGPAEQRDWNAAEPYLFRHVIEHAKDAGREGEITTDPGLLLHPRFAQAHPDLASNAASPADLALAAARTGRLDLASRAANLAGHPPLTWQPRWTIGEPGPEPNQTELLTSARANASRHSATPETAAVALSPDGESIATVGDGGLHRYRWPEQTSDVLTPVSSYPAVTGRLVTFDKDDVLATDSEMLLRISRHLPQFLVTKQVAAVAADPAGDGHFYVTADGLIIHRHDDGAQTLVGETRHRSESWALAVRDGEVIALSTKGGKDLVLFEQGGKTNTYPLRSPVSAFALSEDGMFLAAGVPDSLVVMHTRTREVWPGHLRTSTDITAIAISANGTQVVVGCQDGTVRVTTRGEEIGGPHRLSPSPIVSVAINDTTPIRVVAADADGNVFCRSASQTDQPAAPIAPAAPENLVTAVELLRPGTVAVGLASGDMCPEVDLGNGDMPPLIQFPSEVLGFAPTVVGGEPALLINTNQHHYLMPEDPGQYSMVLVAESDWVAERFRVKPAPAHIVLNGILSEISHDGDLIILAGGEEMGPAVPLGEHPGCRVVHSAYFDGRPFAFTGGDDSAVRVWDLHREAVIDTIHIGRPVWRILTTDQKLLVAAGGELLCFSHHTARQENR